MTRDAIVVGTGYGGAVSAANLARAGMRVGILERGTWWGAAGGHRPLPETLPHMLRALEGVNLSVGGRSLRLPLSRRGLFEVHLHGRTILVNALGVGGTSLVNGALMQRPARGFFAALPPELTAEQLEPCYRSVEQALEVAPGPVDDARQRILGQVARANGWTLSRAPQAIRWGSGTSAQEGECTRCNRCIPGCNVGAKRSMDLTFVPAAVAAGAELRDLCAVQTLEPIAHGYEVRFRNLRTGRGESWTARRVVLAAGTVNTIAILLRSRALAGGLAEASDQLGRHVSLGGDLLAWYRVPAPVVPDHVEGHSAELIVEVPGADGDRDFSFGMLTPPLVPRSGVLRRMQGRRTLSLVGFGQDAANASLSWNGHGLELRHEAQAVVGRTHAAMDRLAAAYGWDEPGRAHDPSVPRRPWMSVHPMGGCRMATDASRGVVDFRGEVFGHPGLHVADASVFAGAPAAGPALSIAALAWWISTRVIEAAGRDGA